MHPGSLKSLAFAVALSGAAMAASAETIERTELKMAVSACQAALPAFDGMIRKRPLAVQNEGSSTAFVSCGLEGVFNAEPHNAYVSIGLVNVGTSDVTIHCTLVDAGNAFTNPVYLPAFRTVLPGMNSAIFWHAEGYAFIYPAISCSLPPGAGIRYVGRRFHEEVGAL